jgi:hypothetical protein
MQVVGTDFARVDTAAAFPVGTVSSDNDGKVYKYLQYDTGAGAVAAVAGNVAFYYVTSGTATATSFRKCTADVTDSIGVGAGVLQSAPADGEYCWVQIKGEATLTTALKAGADGDALTAVGSDDSTLDVSALVTDAIVAYAIDASAKIVACDFPF